jgi:hypothetical protein
VLFFILQIYSFYSNSMFFEYILPNNISGLYLKSLSQLRSSNAHHESITDKGKLNI